MINNHFEVEIGVTGTGSSHTAPQQFGAHYYAKRDMTCNLPIIEKLVLQDMIKLILFKNECEWRQFQGWLTSV